MHLSTGKMHHVQTDWTDNLIWKSEDRTQLVYPSLCRQDYKDFYWKENPELTTTDSKFLKILQLLRGLFINQKRKKKDKKKKVNSVSSESAWLPFPCRFSWQFKNFEVGVAYFHCHFRQDSCCVFQRCL